jgi:hypothetical protein
VSQTDRSEDFAWFVATVVAKEHGRLAIDDVISLTDRNKKSDDSLAKYFARTCNGRHWIGY